MILPSVVRSGVIPNRSWAPPRAMRNPVITSSKMSSAPWAVVCSRRASRKPGLGSQDADVGADRLDDDRGDLVRVAAEHLGDRRDVVVRDHDRVPRGRGGDPGRAGHGQRGQPGPRLDEQAVAVAVVATRELDDEVAAGRSAREPDRAHHRLGAGRDEAQPLHRRHRVADPLAELDLAGGGRPEREPIERSVDNCHDDRGLRVAQDPGTPRPDVVEVPATVRVTDARPLTGLEDQRGLADRAERPDRAVDAARKQRFGASSQVVLAGGSAGFGGPRGGNRRHLRTLGTRPRGRRRHR